MPNPNAYGLTANRCYVGDTVGVFGVECWPSTSGAGAGLIETVGTLNTMMQGPQRGRFPSKAQCSWVCDTTTPGTYTYSLGNRVIGTLAVLPRPTGTKRRATSAAGLATAVRNAVDGDTIWLAPGDYVFDKMIYVNKLVYIRAEGYARFVRNMTDDSATPLRAARDLYIDGVIFDGNVIGTEVKDSLPDGDRIRVILTDCIIRTQIQNANTGGYHGPGPMPDLTMIRCKTQRGGGVQVSGRGLFVDCEFRNGATYPHNVSVNGANQMLFTGNTFDRASRGIVINDANHLCIDGNIARNMGGETNAGEVVLVERQASNVAVVANEFDNSAAPAVQWYCVGENLGRHSRDCIIARNAFRNVSDAIVLWKDRNNDLENFAVCENYFVGCRRMFVADGNVKGARGTNNRWANPAPHPTHIWDIKQPLPADPVKQVAGNDVRIL